MCVTKHLDFVPGEHSSTLCSTDQAELRHSETTHHTPAGVCHCEGVFVHRKAVKCDGLVTQTMESYGGGASQLFNLATWADTERKRNSVNIRCVLCVESPFYHCSPSADTTIFQLSRARVHTVTGLYVACPGTQGG